MPDEPKNEATPQEPELTVEVIDNQPPVVETSDTRPEVVEPILPVPTEPITPKKKNKKALIISGIVAAAIVVLAGGSALAYNLWYQNPDKVVTDALVNAITAKTVSATGSLEAKSDDYTLKIDVAGRNSLEAHSTTAVTLAFNSDDIDFTVKGEGIFSAEGDIYVKLDDARKLADSIEKQSDGQMSFEVFDGVIDKVDGKWIKISSEDLGDFSEEYKDTQKCFAAISKQFESDKAFRATVENETKDLYKAHKFIIVGDKIGSRTISGQGSLGYKLIPDDKAGAEFFRGFGETQLGKKLTECNKDLNFDDFADQTGKEDSSATGEAEIWVSRFGHQITELNVKAHDDDTETSFVLNPIFNKNEAIEIPTNSIPLSELKSDIEKAYEDYYQSYYDSYYNDAAATTTTEFN